MRIAPALRRRLLGGPAAVDRDPRAGHETRGIARQEQRQAADLFQITPNNNLQSGIPEFQVGDCSNAVSDLSFPIAAGAAGFGGTEGYNPCLAVPVEATTWGQIKTQY